MPLRWRSRRRFDGIAAGERSLAGQKQKFAKVAAKLPFGRQLVHGQVFNST